MPRVSSKKFNVLKTHVNYTKSNKCHASHIRPKMEGIGGFKCEGISSRHSNVLLPPLTLIVDPTMNLISGIRYKCERGAQSFTVLQECPIITHYLWKCSYIHSFANEIIKFPNAMWFICFAKLKYNYKQWVED